MPTVPTVPRVSTIALLLGLGLIACREEPPIERHYPARAPKQVEAEPPAVASDGSAPVSETPTDGEPSTLHERPKADPAIDATLQLINASGRMFIDQADEPGERPTEYTAEQFSSMLRSKWDWIGYDIVTVDVWLAEIATRSFKTGLPYLVVLEDGRSVELRPWLDARRREAASAPAVSPPP